MSDNTLFYMLLIASTVSMLTGIIIGMAMAMKGVEKDEDS